MPLWIPPTHHEPLSWQDGCHHYRNGMPTRHVYGGHNAAIIHTNGGGTGTGGDLRNYFESQHSEHGTHIASHFQVSKTGVIYQYIDVARQAWAAWDANPFAVMIETEDDKHPERKWPIEQAQAIVMVLAWCGVPARICPENGSGGGVGWHQQYKQWNQSNHDCPGRERVVQIHDYIIPKLAAA